jgi:hypothetical protein
MASGAAYAGPRCMDGDCLVFINEKISPDGSVKGEGHALCVCGERSDHLPTYRARKRWFSEHAEQHKEAQVA